MNDDVFARAARAVRDSYDGSSSRSGGTRTALLAQAGASRRRRGKVVLFVVPLAAALVLSTAWAAVTGRLPRWLGARSANAPTSVHAQALGATPIGAALPAAPVEAASPPAAVAKDDWVVPAAPPVAAPVESAPPPASASRASRARVSAVAPPAPSPAASVADPEEASFSAAHRLHFVARDPAAALRAWDAYLAAYPNGRFALEARYNRALTLVRLGRSDEARAALAPVADGTTGGYRQREASELLDALGGAR